MALPCKNMVICSYWSCHKSTKISYPTFRSDQPILKYLKYLQLATTCSNCQLPLSPCVTIKHNTYTWLVVLVKLDFFTNTFCLVNDVLVRTHWCIYYFFSFYGQFRIVLTEKVLVFTDMNFNRFYNLKHGSTSRSIMPIHMRWFWLLATGN